MTALDARPAHVGATAGFEAKVLRRRRVAVDVAEFTIEAVDHGQLPSWEAGAHLDVVLKDGTVRQYSLCGDPEDRHSYRIAVLHQPAGRGGSARIHDLLEEGSQVTIRGPRNHFPVEPAGRYVFVAGGIGITPLLPMITRIERLGVPWSLHYGGRSRCSMAYLDELEQLDAGRGRVTVVPFNECGTVIDLDAALTGAESTTAIYCCGPEPLLAAAEQRCAARGLRLRTERFAPRDPDDDTAEPTAFTVRMASTGKEVEVPADRSIADVLYDANIDVLTSCEEGTCGTCETGIVEGAPEHRDSVLTDEERAAGDRLMICVSRSRSPTLVLDL